VVFTVLAAIVFLIVITTRAPSAATTTNEVEPGTVVHNHFYSATGDQEVTDKYLIATRSPEGVHAISQNLTDTGRRA
jgi:hypothetical protein